jgi:putative acetyltransferase
MVRPERAADIEQIRALHSAAFETNGEAELVDRLRRGAEVIALVADDSGQILGHVLFSPVTLPGHGDVRIVGLAPIAVIPERQRVGVGSALIRRGLETCRESGIDAVVLIGHPTYYRRFGFQPASRFGLRSEYDVPDDVFMAMELRPGALTGKSGTIRYHSAFADLA